jgi:hypothetical protein
VPRDARIPGCAVPRSQFQATNARVEPAAGARAGLCKRDCASESDGTLPAPILGPVKGLERDSASTRSGRRRDSPSGTDRPGRGEKASVQPDFRIKTGLYSRPAACNANLVRYFKGPPGLDACRVPSGHDAPARSPAEARQSLPKRLQSPFPSHRLRCRKRPLVESLSTRSDRHGSVRSLPREW